MEGRHIMPRKRKRSSWGCVEPVRNGVWRIRYWRDTPRGRRRVSETFSGTRREANGRLAELRLQSGDDYGGDPTVGELWDSLYRPYAEALVEADRMKPATLRAYESLWNRHVSPRWAEIPCSQVTPGDVQTWLLGMKGPTASTAKAVLSNVLDRAVASRIVPSNAASDCRFVAPSESAGRDKTVWTLEQVRAVGSALRGDPMEAAFLLQAHGGLRVGEAFAVTVSDVTEASTRPRVAAVRVDKTSAMDAAGTVGPTKTRKGRTAYLVGEPADRLLELRDEAAAEGRELLSEDFGRPYTRFSARRVWDTAELPAGVPRIPMRNLRNSYETYMHWELGVPIGTTSKLLGHASTATTERHYDRPSSDAILCTLLEVYNSVGTNWDAASHLPAVL